VAKSSLFIVAATATLLVTALAATVLLIYPAGGSVPYIHTNYTLNVSNPTVHVRLILNGQPITRRWGGIRGVVHVDRAPEEGAPAVRTSSLLMTYFDLTPFIVDGRNTGCLTVEAPSSGFVWAGSHTATLRTPDVAVYRLVVDEEDVAIFAHAAPLKTGVGINPQGLTIIFRLPIPRPSLEQTPSDNLSVLNQRDFEFTASVPVRWRWQDADDIGDLTPADREAILAAIAKLGDAYTRRDWQAVKSLCITWWHGKQAPRGMLDVPAIFDQITGEVQRYDDYTVAVASPETVHFETGSKVVQAFVEKGHIIYAGHSKASEERTSTPLAFDPVIRTGDDGEMHFMKLDGRWRPVLSFPQRVFLPGTENAAENK